MSESLTFGRYTIVGHDVRGYGQLDGSHQQQMQSDLKAMLDAAAAQAGLNRAGWWRQEAGDGELAILPGSESELRVVDDYVRHLSHQLRLHNRDRVGSSRVGMRLVIHHGSAKGGAMGVVGNGIVRAARLLDSAQAKDALAEAGGDRLLVVVSETVFETSVAPGYITLDPGQFRAVHAETKEGLVPAYLFLPDPPTVAQAAPAEEPKPRKKSNDGRTVKTVIKDATFHKAVFGFEGDGD